MSIRGRSKATGIQMFPFLDALICTMGALLVLLHAFASHDKTRVTKELAAKIEAQRVEDQDAIELHQWRTGHLTEARRKTAAQLADERARLAHVEDHQRRLEEKLRQLRLSAAELERIAGASGAKEQNAAALAEVNEKLAAARTAVAEAKQKSSQSVRYSIVPFQSKDGTRRRPIYIECTDRAVTIQPDGIEFTAHDFEGLMGPHKTLSPGNPLAAAVRAQQEFFARQTPPGQTPELPYPLLVVRPNGIIAFYAARSALESWGGEFGYELVGENWDLQYPDTVPEVGELTQRVAGDARVRYQEFLASAQYAASRQRSRARYRVNAQGRVEKVDQDGNPIGSGDDDEQLRGNGAEDGLGQEADMREEEEGGNLDIETDLPGNGGDQVPTEDAYDPKLHVGKKEQTPRPIAATRGKDWGVHYTIGDVAASRPILIQCFADRLVIVSESRNQAGKQIPLGEYTRDSMDEFVSSVTEHTKTWGKAGKKLYWRPNLIIDVAPGAEKRFSDIQVLLAGSGLDVSQRNAAPTAQQPSVSAPVR